jgi:hypothetical protein
VFQIFTNTNEKFYTVKWESIRWGKLSLDSLVVASAKVSPSENLSILYYFLTGHKKPFKKFFGPKEGR